jgi:hypothetical protein
MRGQKLTRRISNRSLDILLNHSVWRNLVIEADTKPSLPPNYQPDIIEFFDQGGLLTSRVYGYVFNFAVPTAHKSEFLASFFDGQLVLFIIGSEVLINRLVQVSVFGLFDAPLSLDSDLNSSDREKG